ncbi:Sugar transporter erd6-like [Thalictrum thalictroides]|uniref:Sugar transporter erd6-like n=1 Tax=Thalictrum thalictroides TaxID=46969 RepID=A0A7J6X2A0_THATH|nr:Sugar transporter erd6-like [Thalictrum thalictroides]
MANNHNVENGDVVGREEISIPLILKEKVADLEDISNKGDSLWMVLLSTFVAVCGSFEFGCIIGYSAPTQSGITDDLGLSLSEYSVFGSAATIGAMIGAATSGRIADYIGRKEAMRVSSVFCLAGWLAVNFANGAVSLDIGRLSTGYGMGLLSYVVPVFISEIAPKNLRGGLATLNQLMLICGVSITFIIGTVISWRTLTLIGIVPCFFLFFGLFLIPDSPRWLAKVGRQKDFEIALRELRGKNADISTEAEEIQDYIETLQHLPKAKMLDLFQRRYLLSLVIGVGLMLIQQFGGINGICFYVSHVFESAGVPANVGTIIYACVQVPITVLGAFLMDRAGRRLLLFVSSSGLVIGSLLVGTSFFLKAHELSLDWVPALALIGIMTYIGSFSIGMGAVPWVIMSEIFPINVKGTAGSLIALVNWFASWVVSLSFNFLLSWSSSGTFLLFGGVNAVAILFIAKLVPETKGRTLEEIQASINA